MRSGNLDRLIDIQRKAVSQSESGEPIEAWANVVARRAAQYRPLRGDERFSDPQIVARGMVEFRVRYSSSIADISPLDRVIYPAMNDESPPPAPDATRVHDIVAVQEIGRREGLQIIARRRMDAT